MNKNALKIVTLFLPVIVMALLIGMHSNNKESGNEWRIPVTGYDPRDLLRGHYLTFRYDWNWDDRMNVACSGQSCALCLQENGASGSYNPKVYVSMPEVGKKQCDGFIKGYSSRSRHFEIGTREGNGLRRYYIPEADAGRLDALLRRADQDGHKFDMGLRVNNAGQAFIEQMYIDGIALEEWIKKNH
jgi:hypothetical protein